MEKRGASIIFRQIDASCALTDNLVSAGVRGDNIEVFQLFLVIFDQFSPIVKRIFHQKMLGACLFGQACLYGEIR